MKKLICSVILVIAMCSVALAHGGKTDASGGHIDSYTGEYHYHHGYSAHQHDGGICPYDFDDRTSENSGSSSGSGAVRYVAYAETEDWYDEYLAANNARRSAEKELQELKSIQMRNLAISAVVGLCGGLSVLIVQIRQSHKRLEETERRLFERSQNAMNSLKAEYDRRESANESARQNNCKMYAQMALESKTYSERVKNVQMIVQNTTIPDQEDGVVYVAQDMGQRMYHNNYEACGIQHMILISKRSAVKYGLKQCPVCNSVKQPEADLSVTIPFAGSGKCYHIVGSHCLTVPYETTLSVAKAKGYVPCARCKPPSDNPKVWF